MSGALEERSEAGRGRFGAHCPERRHRESVTPAAVSLDGAGTIDPRWGSKLCLRSQKVSLRPTVRIVAPEASLLALVLVRHACQYGFPVVTAVAELRVGIDEKPLVRRVVRVVARQTRLDRYRAMQMRQPVELLPEYVVLVTAEASAFPVERLPEPELVLGVTVAAPVVERRLVAKELEPRGGTSGLARDELRADARRLGLHLAGTGHAVEEDGEHLVALLWRARGGEDTGDDDERVADHGKQLTYDGWKQAGRKGENPGIRGMPARDAGFVFLTFSYCIA